MIIEKSRRRRMAASWRKLSDDVQISWKGGGEAPITQKHPPSKSELSSDTSKKDNCYKHFNVHRLKSRKLGIDKLSLKYTF